MKIRLPLGALSLLLVACAAPGRIDDEELDIPPADDGGVRTDADANTGPDANADPDAGADGDAATDADADPEGGAEPDGGELEGGTDPDAGTEPDANPATCEPECEAGQRCEGGVCVCDAASCPTGCCTAVEAGSCVAGNSINACGQGGGLCVSCDPIIANSCGATGCECNGGPPCAVGKCAGPQGCIDLQNDPRNCGSIGNDCLGHDGDLVQQRR